MMIRRSLYSALCHFTCDQHYLNNFELLFIRIDFELKTHIYITVNAEQFRVGEMGDISFRRGSIC